MVYHWHHQFYFDRHNINRLRWLILVDILDNRNIYHNNSGLLISKMAD